MNNALASPIRKELTLGYFPGNLISVGCQLWYQTTVLMVNWAGRTVMNTCGIREESQLWASLIVVTLLTRRDPVGTLSTMLWAVTGAIGSCGAWSL